MLGLEDRHLTLDSGPAPAARDRLRIVKDHYDPGGLIIQIFAC